MKKKYIKVILAFILVFLIPGTIVKAKVINLSMDGKFSDWANLSFYQITNSTYFSEASVVYDRLYVYVHVKEKKSDPWATNYPNIKITCDGTSKDIVIARSDYSGRDGIFDILVKNAYWNDISNAQGKVLRKSGYNEWEFKLPINDIFIPPSSQTTDNLKEQLVNSLQISWSMGGALVLSGFNISEIVTPTPTVKPTPTVIPTPTVKPTLTPIVTTTPTIKPTPTVASSPTVTPVTMPTKIPTTALTATPVPTAAPTGVSGDPGGTGGGSAGGSGIMIDGYFDDWESMPKTGVYYSESMTNQGSIMKDDDYIYLYIEMASSNTSQLPMDGINLTINEVECQLFVRYPNSSDTTDWGRSVSGLVDGIYTGLAPFTYNPNNKLGDAAIRISSGNPNDQLELRVNISALEEVMGLEAGTINSGLSITVSLPNVGDQKLEIVGTSTGTIIGIGISMMVVMIMKSRRSKRKKIPMLSRGVFT